MSRVVSSSAPSATVADGPTLLSSPFVLPTRAPTRFRKGLSRIKIAEHIDNQYYLSNREDTHQKSALKRAFEVSPSHFY